MFGMPLSGDELGYNKSASSIGHYLSYRGVTFEETIRTVVGLGRFMPGMPIILSPLYAFFGNPDLIHIRLYAATFSFLVWLWMIRDVGKHFGSDFALILLIFPTLSITWQLFGNAIWGDVSAGMIMAAVLARGFSISRKIIRHEPLPWVAIFQLELLLVFMVYLRGPLFLVVLALHAFIISLIIIDRSRNWLTSYIPRFVAGFLLVAVMIAPWSLTATSQLNAPVLLTTTLPISFAVTFGDRSKICFGECPEIENKSIWYEATRFSQFHAARTGSNEYEVQRRMAKLTLENLKLRQYLTMVSKNFQNYVLTPHGFNRRFIYLNELVPVNLRLYVQTVFQYLGNSIYFVFFTGWMAANLILIRNNVLEQIASLMIKMFTLCLFLQPFIHVSHPRYWVTFAPLMAIGTMYLVSIIRSEIWKEPVTNEQLLINDPKSRKTDIIQPLYVFQLLYVLGFVSIAVAIFLA